MNRFAYKLLERVAELYAEVSLEDVLLLACQHLLEPQQRMFELLLNAGLHPENCVIVGKSYSTNAAVMNDLAETGCIVAPFSLSFDPLRTFDDWFEEHMTSFVAEELGRRDLNDYRKVVVLDDGGFLHTAVSDSVAEYKSIVGIEQTSSGHHRIQAKKIQFPTVSVARSYHKLLFESPLIGKDALGRIV